MIQGYGHQVDHADLAFALERFPKSIQWNHKAFYTGGTFHPHVTDFVDKDGIHHAIFHIKPIYYESVGGFVRPLSEITASHGNRHIALKDNWEMFVSFRYFTWLMRRQAQIGSLSIQGYTLQPRHYVFATTTDFYPDTGTGSTTVDGGFETDSTARTWANTVALTTANLWGNSSTTFRTHGYRALNTDNYQFMNRAGMTFNTAAIGSGSTISDATLNLYFTGKVDEAGHTPNVDIYVFTPASNNDIVGGDFDNYGTTSQTGSPIAYASITTGAYNTFTFDATGRGNISKTGVSGFGTRNANYDVANSAPAHVTVTRDQFITASAADDVSGSQDPKLTVTYSAGGGTPVVRNSNLLLMGVG